MLSVFALIILGAAEVPVPATCTPAVNAKLAGLVNAGRRKPVDNVMVCGIAAGPSHTQKGGKHGDHQIIALHTVFPGGVHRIVQVVTNDALDGKVTATDKAVVFAYGQAFFDRTRNYVAGIHDVHCATHEGADNGFVIVNGEKFPAAVCGTGPLPKQRRFFSR